MKRSFAYLFLFSILLILSNRSYGQTTEPIYQLIERVLPGKTAQFELQIIPNSLGKEYFEIESKKGKIVIHGTNNLSITKGLGYYLNNYCGVRVSWYKDNAVLVPKVLPIVPEKVVQECRFEKRFFLNYCTFGYTMLWWQWEDWERFIDWMALNGINMPLAITGQEAVWMEVWKEFGLSESDIRAYFTGPAHLPWHRMGNLDGFLGPLPLEYITHQKNLQKQILQRERSFGMTPVLPAFAGHVPKAIKDQYPNSKITNMGSYGTGEEYNAYFLDPTDSLFLKIQQRFLAIQTQMFGTDHFYGADPFNEMDPPEITPSYLGHVSKTIYDGMQSVDPEAVWVQMGWTFYYMKLWREEPKRLEAMIHAVPENKMIILDYFAEKEEVWRSTKAWYGAPYVWCYLGNFGGNTEMAAPIKEVAVRLPKAEQDSTHGKMWGIGSTLEGFGVNQFMFDWLFEYAWDQTNQNLNQWIPKFVLSRTNNKVDKIAEQAYSELINLVYNDQVSGIATGSLVQARPFLTGVRGYQRPNKYDYKKLTEILGLMLTVSDETVKNPLYQKDLVIVTKQILDNMIIPLRKKINQAYVDKDSIEMNKQITLFINILSDLDRLLATQPEFLLGKWLSDARQFGDDSKSKAYYEKNARVLITTWGNEGNEIIDYASRDLSGLISSYYKVRWELFFKTLNKNLQENIPLDLAQSDRDMAAFEWAWTNQNIEYINTPQGDPVKIVQEIYAKYLPYFAVCND